MIATVNIDASIQIIETEKALYINKLRINNKTVDVVFGPKTKHAFKKSIESIDQYELQLDGFEAKDIGYGPKFIVNNFMIKMPQKHNIYSYDLLFPFEYKDGILHKKLAFRCSIDRNYPVWAFIDEEAALDILNNNMPVRINYKEVNSNAAPNSLGGVMLKGLIDSIEVV